MTALNKIRSSICGSSAMCGQSSMLNAIRCMSSKIYVGGLSLKTDDQGLKEAFSRFGAIESAQVIKARDTDRSRGFGFVEFTGDESASSAVSAMDGQILRGRHIRVAIAVERGYGCGGSLVLGGGYGNKRQRWFTRVRRKTLW